MAKPSKGRPRKSDPPKKKKKKEEEKKTKSGQVIGQEGKPEVQPRRKAFPTKAAKNDDDVDNLLKGVPNDWSPAKKPPE